MKRSKICGLILGLSVVTLLAAGCSLTGKSAAMKEKEDFIFNTMVSLKLYEPVDDTVFQTVFDDQRSVENHMSAQAVSGELVDVNKAAGIQPVVVSEDTYHVIDVAKKYAEESGGAFDVTIYPVTSLWKIGTDAERIPAQSEIDAGLKNVGYQDLVLDPVAHTIFLKRPGMGLDLGAIAKGYAADRASAQLKSLGIERGIINLGGNIIAMGTKADGSAWNIGIQNPVTERGEYIGIVNVIDQTVVTSGIYERYFEKDGKRYHHILDTKTGYPVDNDLAGVSILTHSSIDADALSTTCFALGVEKALAFVKDRPDVDVMFITKDKKVTMTPGFKKVFKLTDTSFTVVE